MQQVSRGFSWKRLYHYLSIGLLTSEQYAPSVAMSRQGCGRRWCRANALFAELKGGSISVPLQEAAWLAGCSWSYRAASAVLKRLCGAQISAEEIRLLLNRQGQQRAAQQQAEAQRVCSAPPQPSEATEQTEQFEAFGHGWRLGGQSGAARWHGREGGSGVCASRQSADAGALRDVFLERAGSRRPPRQRHRLLKRRYVATFGPAEQLGQLAKAAARTVSEHAPCPVVVLADEAQWIKLQQRRHFPQATCILDWAHLWREVRHAIHVAARAKPLSARARDYQLYLQRTWLWYGQVDQALQGLAASPQGCPPSHWRPSPRR